MYKIESTSGVVLGYVDEPRYIRLSKNGSYVQAPKELATGVAFNSNPYHLVGKDELKGALDYVFVVKIDSGEVLFNSQMEIMNQLIDLQEASVNNAMSDTLSGLKI